VRTRVCAFLLALAVSTAPTLGAVATTKYSLTNSGWTDLGAGPLLLGFNGTGVFAVSDTTPSLNSEGFGIRAGRSFPVKTTSHVWATAPSASSVNAYAAPINGGGGGSSSVWSASDAAANGMPLSNGGLTVAPSGAAGYLTIRNSVGKATGKLYAEISVDAGFTTTNDGSVAIGLASADFNPSGGTDRSYLGENPYSAGIFPTIETYVSAGFTKYYISSSPIIAANTTYGVAVDFTAGNVWFSNGGIWTNASNPATGSLPIVSFVPATVGPLFFGVSFAGTNLGLWTIHPTAASQKYAPPTGFSPWN
jgi:hypothetical protein